MAAFKAVSNTWHALNRGVWANKEFLPEQTFSPALHEFFSEAEDAGSLLDLRVFGIFPVEKILPAIEQEIAERERLRVAGESQSNHRWLALNLIDWLRRGAQHVNTSARWEAYIAQQHPELAGMPFEWVISALFPADFNRSLASF